MRKVEKDDIAKPEPSLEEFESEIKKGVIDPHPYHRLMVAYRKQKDLKQELRVIRRGIEVFTDHLEATQKNILKGHRKRSSIVALSKTISKKMGLVDTKGNAQHIPEPVATWMKRKELVENKIRAFAKK